MYLSKLLNLFVRIAKLICQNFQMDLSKFPNNFGKISKWICQNFEMVLSKFSNGFVWIADCICPNYTAKQRESREGRMEGWSEAAPGVAPTSFPLSLSLHSLLSTRPPLLPNSGRNISHNFGPIVSRQKTTQFFLRIVPNLCCFNENGSPFHCSTKRQICPKIKWAVSIWTHVFTGTAVFT